MKKNADVLNKVPIAYFFTSPELTQTGQDIVGEIIIYLDPNHGTPPKNPDILNFKEIHNTPSGFRINKYPVINNGSYELSGYQ